MLLLITSCGENGRNPASESQLGASLLTGGSFSDAEKNIAIRTCYAFRSKNTNFRANFLEQEFRFLLTDRTCNGNENVDTLTTTLKAPLASGPMIFDGFSSISYYKDVQTDKDGVLSAVCNNLLQGGNPQRTILSGNEMIEISFFTSVQDIIVVRTASKQDGKYIVNEEERFNVSTDSSTAGLKTGEITLVSRDKTCLNGRVSTMSQQSL